MVIKRLGSVIITCTLYINVSAITLLEAVQENNLKKVKKLIKSADDVREPLETAVAYGYDTIAAEILNQAGSQLTNNDLRLALTDAKRLKILGEQQGWKSTRGVAMPKKESVQAIISLLVGLLQKRGENISQ